MVSRLQVLREGLAAAKTMRNRTDEIKEVMIVFDDNTQIVKAVTHAMQSQVGDEHLLTITVRLN